MPKPTIEGIIGRDAMAALARPVDEASGLPAAAYMSSEFHALEQGALFPAVWVGIGFAGDIPATGDAVPLTLAGCPLIALRDETGAVQVFHNVCRHRATVILPAPARGLARLQCPYHAWTYGLDGALQATPFWDGTRNATRAGVDKATHGLVPVRSHVWNHVIFVNLDGKAPAPSEYFAPAFGQFADLEMNSLVLAHRETWEFAANWKLVLENWENYHHVWVHDGIFDKMSDEVDLKTGASYTETLPEGNVLTLRRTAAAPPRAGTSSQILGALPPIPQKAGSPAFSGCTTAVLPNTTMTTGINTYAPVVYTPLGPDRTRASMAWYFVGSAAEAPEFAAARGKVLDRWLGASRQMCDRTGLRSQDYHCLELQQAARGSAVADIVRFSPTWERNVHHFQNWVVERLATPPA